MRYFFAIFCPPFAVLLCGKPVQCLFNFFLTFLFWIPGMIHALLVVQSYEAHKRTERLIRAFEKGKR